MVDTDILIKSNKGDKNKQNNLKYFEGKYCIFVITACELLNGAKNIHQLGEFNKALRYYNLALIDEKISDKAFTLFKKYSFINDMKVSDSFIAATAIRNDLFLYTDNKKDLNFIKEIKFYKEK
ncbi:MAG: PIN domain-containing protein [Ginsengibacter sp.]